MRIKNKIRPRSGYKIPLFPKRGNHQAKRALLPTRGRFSYHVADDFELGLPSEHQRKNGVLILDATHNPQSLGVGLAWLEQKLPTYRKRVLFAMYDDKNWREMLKRLARFSARVQPTQSNAPETG